ncbi:hypothetical protein BP6252_13050 [Coleophoma cylindrospora]|uniref:Zn(2)-C6 fungal-type domain-containing protein n=1 Tax=Coleophoma cylindrospora TaxID=1849047 RepID=A0A3D8QDN9_9HELO|nr:hypothetical protein BP6252_13050 [Coleophoma cylindrospora]
MDPTLRTSAGPSQQRQVVAEDTGNHAYSEAKRRKVRKGTRSCWECKRRKMKCIFHPISSVACNGCRRRGSKCVKQDVLDETSISVDAATYEMSDGAVQVETLANQLAKDVGGDSTPSVARTPSTPCDVGRRTDHSILTPASTIPDASRNVAFYASTKHCTVNINLPHGASELYKLQSATDAPVQQAKCERLSQFLHEALPSREDTERICKANRHPSVLHHDILTMPYTTIDQSGLKTAENLLEIPKPNFHPVLIARYMLQLAIFLQRLHPEIHEEIKGLSESPRVMMERLANLAISLVTSNDELLGSIEALECIMLESMYQVNVGNLRRSWVAGRRAMGIAELMSLNRSNNRAQYQVLDPKGQVYPQFMWFRILYLDRQLCLMLGLSPGSLDRSMASDAMLANDTPTGRLERIHCVIASRILERNEGDSSCHDISLTRALDMELQRAARSLPSKWWLAPSLDVASTDSKTLFQDVQRLFAQLLHYNLLNQLHLPYMLRSSSAERQSEFSRITCVNSSREVLSRFIILRSFNRVAYSCRIVDFLAIMAAMTLLLAQLDSHRSETDNPLAHQFYSDRAMIEQAHDNMKEVNQLNSDALSAQSADLLRRLLAIEAEIADGCSLSTARVSVQESGTEMGLLDQNDDAIIGVHIPYFGIIKIARESMSKEFYNLKATSIPHYQEILHSEPSGSPNVELMTPVDGGYREVEASSMLPQAVPNAYSKIQAQLEETSIPSTGADDIATCFAPQVQNGLSDNSQHEEYPGLAAGGDDWAFQGVDMAFFDNLMRSAGNEGNKDSDWTAWQR